jgi:site-specific recombinase XerD
MDYKDELPEILCDFLVYHETIKGHSQKTADEYFLDLRMFFRYLKVRKGLVPMNTPFDEISIRDIDLAFVKDITLSDIYDFLAYLARDRIKTPHSADAQTVGGRSGAKSKGAVNGGKTVERGLSAASRARKIASLRSYFKYLTLKTKQLETNPVADLDSPKILKTLPRYLSLDESMTLLSAIDGPHKARDFCIITLFLNCGLRISELAGLNLADIRSDNLRVIGKGGKERVVYLNDACVEALNAYLLVRRDSKAAGKAPQDKNALFLSQRNTRITKSTVHHLVKTHLARAGLDADKYSSHKLRHTAATLMLRNGVDVRTLQELLGHEHLNTTQIYTHVESDSLREAAALSPLSKFKPDK